MGGSLRLYLTMVLEICRQGAGPIAAFFGLTAGAGEDPFPRPWNSAMQGFAWSVSPQGLG